MTRPARTGPTTGPTTRPATRRASTLATVVVLLLTVALGGCSGGDERHPAADPSRGGRATTLHLRTLPTTLRTGVVSGRLPRADRQRVVQAVGHVVDRWIDAAYLGGTYPRRDFRRAFPGFTAGARRLALADRDLMSNQDIGGRIDGVRPVRRVVVVDLLAVRGHARGATARVRLGFRTTGALARRYVVRARLALSHTDGWQVFGYDASKGSAA